MTYVYDGRGNLTGEYCDGRLLHGYAYNAANRLEKTWDGRDGEAIYFYNVLGQRTGKYSEKEAEEYVLDLTKPYHNLLGIEKSEGMQKFFWDSNVAVMEDERRSLHYYMQDELGSPLRVLYESGRGEVYGYDEFGRETSLEGRYSRQGVNQPFGYTGYRYDVVGGTYFAQAREYQPAYGRFLAEDRKRGRAAVPKTRNRYGYCWNNPVGMVDLNGMEPELPGEKIWFQKAPSPEENLDAIVSGLMEPKKEKKSSSSFVDLEELWSTIQATPMPEAAPPEEDYGGGITAKIREITKEWEGAFVFSTTGCLGDGLYTSGGYQLAIDWHGNVVIYPVCGVGAQAGSSAKFDFAVGYLDVPTAEDVKGFGTETGVSARLFGIVPGISWITSNEDDGEFIGNGGMFHIGLGGNPTIIEAHTSMSGSPEMPRLVNRFNIYDRIDEFGFWMESKI